MLGLFVVATSIDLPMRSQDNRRPDMSDNSDVRQLTRALAPAYGNALKHDGPARNLELEDATLETASIRLSSLIAREISGSCNDTVRRASTSNPACSLEDESVDLRNLSDSLSYAAARLESQARLADRSQGANAFHRARIASLAHLYRTVFALAKGYFDRAQSESYLKAAHEQINLARASLEAERELCSCDPQPYTARLEQLAQLDDAVLNIPPQH